MSTWADEGVDIPWCARHPSVDAAEIAAMKLYKETTGRYVIWPPNYLEDENHMITQAVRRAWLALEQEPEPIQAPEPEPIQAPEPEPIQAPEPEPIQAPEPEPIQAFKSRVSSWLVFKKPETQVEDTMYDTLIDFVDHHLKIIENFFDLKGEVILVGRYLRPKSYGYQPDTYWKGMLIERLLQGLQDKSGKLYPSWLPGGRSAIQLLNDWCPPNVKVELHVNKKTGSMLIFAYSKKTYHWCSIEHNLRNQGYREYTF